MFCLFFRRVYEIWKLYLSLEIRVSIKKRELNRNKNKIARIVFRRHNGRGRQANICFPANFVTNEY